MADIIELNPTDVIHFRGSHRPVLLDGTYEIQASHILEHGDENSPAIYPAAAAKFVVSGPRFSIADSEVESVFPPSGASGLFDQALPNIILKSDTLPWERSPLQQARSENSPPWVALLVLSADDPVIQSTKTVAEARRGDPEPGESDSAAVVTIQVALDLLLKILPAKEELGMLAHVRQVAPAGDEANPLPARSVVLANRLPTAGKAMTAHLVSLERLYDENGFVNTPAADPVSLISLYRWTFFAESPQFGHFEEIMGKVNRGSGSDAAGLEFQLPSGQLATDEAGRAAKKYLDSGYIPLPHRFRQGDTSISWYHGPLVPLGSAGSVGSASEVLLTSPQAGASVPALASDELLLCDAATGMFDVSYASAWEIGRLLMLQNTRLAPNLYEWKKAKTRQKKMAAAAGTVSHLPKPPNSAGDADPGDALFDAIVNWFNQELVLMGALPFRYLVADDGLLPTESMRFFTIDRLWMDCMIDGAFSVARHTAGDIPLDRELMALISARLTFPASGLLLRSAVVPDFPGMQMEAYAGRGPALPPDGSIAPPTLKLLRKENLAPSVLLALFDASNVTTADFHLPPESLHFGVSITELPGALRDPSNATVRVLSITRLATQNGQQMTTEDFALKLIARVLKVRFTREAN